MFELTGDPGQYDFDSFLAGHYFVPKVLTFVLLGTPVVVFYTDPARGHAEV